MKQLVERFNILDLDSRFERLPCSHRAVRRPCRNVDCGPSDSSYAYWKEHTFACLFAGMFSSHEKAKHVMHEECSAHRYFDSAGASLARMANTLYICIVSRGVVLVAYALVESLFVSRLPCQPDRNPSYIIRPFSVQHLDRSNTIVKAWSKLSNRTHQCHPVQSAYLDFNPIPRTRSGASRIRLQ